MRLRCHIASTTSRPLLMFVTDQRFSTELKSVDLFTGEHLGESFAALNPNRPDLEALPRLHSWLARLKRSPLWVPTDPSIERYVAGLPRAEWAVA